MPTTETVGHRVNDTKWLIKDHGKINMDFIAAYVVPQGQTVSSVRSDLYDDAAPPQTPFNVNLDRIVTVRLRNKPSRTSTEIFSNNTVDELRRALVSRSLISFVSPIVQTGWLSVPPTYVFAQTHDAEINYFLTLHGESDNNGEEKRAHVHNAMFWKPGNTDPSLRVFLATPYQGGRVSGVLGCYGQERLRSSARCSYED
jgi:hypothetical protein